MDGGGIYVGTPEEKNFQLRLVKAKEKISGLAGDMKQVYLLNADLRALPWQTRMKT